MSEYQPVPVEAAREIANRYGKSMVVILAYDQVHESSHTTTYGRAPVDKIRAAWFGERCTALIGGDLARVSSYEDFRTIDAAKRAAAIERLTKACKAADHVIASMMALDGASATSRSSDEQLGRVRFEIAEALKSGENA